jgi:hypothetical protein
VAQQCARTIARVKAEDTKALATQRANDNKVIANLQQRLAAASNERDAARSNVAAAQHEADVNDRVGVILSAQVRACQKVHCTGSVKPLKIRTARITSQR